MAQATEQTPTSPEIEAKQALAQTVAIDNRETRIVILASTKPGRSPKGAKEKGVLIPREKFTHQLAPGINFVPLGIVKACTLKDGSDFDGRPLAKLTISVWELPDYEALSLIARSKSAQALAAWAKAETRPKVLEAIKARLPRAQ